MLRQQRLGAQRPARSTGIADPGMSNLSAQRLQPGPDETVPQEYSLDTGLEGAPQVGFSFSHDWRVCKQPADAVLDTDVEGARQVDVRCSHRWLNGACRRQQACLCRIPGRSSVRESM